MEAVIECALLLLLKSQHLFLVIFAAPQGVLSRWVRLPSPAVPSSSAGGLRAEACARAP